MGLFKRAKPELFVLPELPDWADQVSLETGEILLDDAPRLDVSGLDVLGQDEDQEEAVRRVGERASAFFGGAPRPGLGGGVGEEPAEQLLLPPPREPAPPVVRGGLRLVPSEPDVEGEREAEVEEPERVSLFGGLDDDEDDDDGDG